MAEHTFILPGNPIPWARAGYNRNTQVFYDRQRDERIHTELLVQCLFGNTPLFKGPLALYVTFYLPIPKSLPKKKILEMENTYHWRKPDKDNLEKWLSDICTKIVYTDDCQIAVSQVEKRFSNNPRTEFMLKELE